MYLKMIHINGFNYPLSVLPSSSILLKNISHAAKIKKEGHCCPISIITYFRSSITLLCASCGLCPSLRSLSSGSLPYLPLITSLATSSSVFFSLSIYFTLTQYVLVLLLILTYPVLFLYTTFPHPFLSMLCTLRTVSLGILCMMVDTSLAFLR